MVYEKAIHTCCYKIFIYYNAIILHTYFQECKCHIIVKSIVNMNGYYNSTLRAISNYSTKPSTQDLSHTDSVHAVYRKSQTVDRLHCTPYIHHHTLYHHSFEDTKSTTMVMSLVEELSPLLSRTSLYRYFSIQSNGSHLSKLHEYDIFI